MKQEIPAIRINLSARKESFTNVFLKWSVHIGRVIIIATELIALSALFYRFIIDRQIVDLHDQINSELVIIKYQEQKELEYRQLQKRLSSVRLLTQDTTIKLQALNSVISEINKEGIIASQFNLASNVIHLAGRSSSILNLNELINNLKKADYISSINIEQIRGSKQGVDFGLTIAFKNSL